MRKASPWIAWLAGGYLLFGTMIYFLQEKLIFLPARLSESYQYQFENPFEEIFLKAKDGARLNAVHFKRRQPNGVMLYFHGNAGNLSRWGEVGSELATTHNFDVLIMDYRTYGKSNGQLSEEALQDDGQLFYEYLLNDYEEDQIVLYGRSLGTGIATRLAAENNPRQLVLETPYLSLLDIGERRFPFLPVKWLLKYQFKSFEFVKDIRCPVAVFHGTEDEVIPIESGEELYDKIPAGNKYFIRIQGGRHNNLSSFEEYQENLTQFLTDGSIE